MMTLKQRLFVKLYFQTFNATEAAFNVYRTKNRQSAAVIGSRLLRNVNIQREMNALFEAKGLSLESIIDSIEAIARSKPQKVTSADVLRANLELLKLQGVV